MKKKYSIPGFRAAGVHCGLKKSPSRLDLGLIVSDRPAAAAGVFTRNRFPGAPVVVSRQRIRRGSASAIVVNSGNSNVANGEQGLRDAREMARLAAQAIGAAPADVQVSSTGVIGRPLPMDKIARGIAEAAQKLSADGWNDAARAILTTDNQAKIAKVDAKGFGLLGIAKGSGMIMPDMATMLAFLATDAAVEPAFLREALRESAGATFNRLTIDGETSTSDMVIVLANGAAGGRPLTSGSAGAADFRRALGDLCAELAERLAVDGEGVTRVASVTVRRARTEAHAERMARRVANSVLVKTALFGADPNWGRVVQAMGTAGVAFRPDRVSVRVAGVEFLRHGVPVGDRKALDRAQRAMQKKRVEIEIDLAAGEASASVLTTDLGYGYVKINAEYTT